MKSRLEPDEIYDSAALTPVIDDFRQLWRRRQLIRILTKRDLELRYRRSLLGIGWTLLNPMLQMLVLWIVFSHLFRFSTTSAPYIVYVLSGIVMATLISNVIVSAASSLGVNSVFLTRIRIPGEVFAIAAVGELFVSYLFSLVPLIVIMLIAGPGLSVTVPLALVPSILLALFGLGVGLMLAPWAARFPDVIVLTGVVLTLVTYLAPVFYPFSIVPAQYRIFEHLNPLFYFLRAFRSLLYENRLGPWDDWAVMVGVALIALLLGSTAVVRSRKSVVAYVS